MKKLVKCAVKGCKSKATSWINKKFVCVKHFYQIQIRNGKAPRKMPQWMIGIGNTKKMVLGKKIKGEVEDLDLGGAEHY